MTTMDPRAVAAYVRVKTFELTNAELVSEAQELLNEDPIPAWVSEIAAIDPYDYPTAHNVLEKELAKDGILPDSEALRAEIRARVLAWAKRVEEQDRVEFAFSGYELSVVALLRLIPGYAMSQLEVPIEEFPYPLSEVQKPQQLAQYLRDHLDELVPPRLGS